MNKDLNSLSQEELGLLFPIIISQYNPGWIDLFKSEKKLIQKINGVKIVEHIGSTAIPGLIAKPAIDILIEIEDDTFTDSISDSLKLIGYHPIPKSENPPPHLMLAKGYTSGGFSGQQYHIHVRFRGDWDEIYFRDYLIQHHGIALEYASLKLKLSEIYPNDREKYTDSKTEFVTRISKIARREKKK